MEDSSDQSYRNSTKGINKLRLNAKRKKPGPKKNKGISLIPSASSQESVEPENENINKKRRLHLSSPRKRKAVPAALIKWKIENAQRKISSSQYKNDLFGATSYMTTSNVNPSQSKISSSQYEKDLFGTTSNMTTSTVNPSQRENNNCSDYESEFIIEEGPKVLDNMEKIKAGNYIVNGSHFVSALRKLELHKFHCTKSNYGYMKLVSSIVMNMVWKLNFTCPYCNRTTVVSSEPIDSPYKSKRNPKEGLSMVEKCVWGFSSIGSGHENMEEVLSSMEITPVCPKTFRDTEAYIGKMWRDVLFETMKEAGEKERQLAIDCGDVDQGVPFITTIIDGGWSKRSHGHNYTANSGVTCVIGSRTKKLLDVGVRNKYCSLCEYRKKHNIQGKHDNCYKNWDGPSSSMETDMLVESFRRSKELHGLEYRTIIGDGDSSVFCTLQKLVPYGRKITKIECANHAVKNYTSKLYALQKESVIQKKIFTKQIIKRLTSAARGAIISNSETGDVVALKEDLRNGPLHVFGNHLNCKNYFCLKAGQGAELTTTQTSAIDKARFCLTRIISKSTQLITNSTSNLAENYMSLVAKFIGGKQVNRGKRGSYTHRTKAAALDFQLGPSWHYKSMKKITSKSPASITKKIGIRKEKRRSASRKCLFKLGPENNRKKRYEKKNEEKNGKEDYGIRSIQPDMEDTELHALMEEKIKELSISVDEIRKLEINTRGQAENEEWHVQRSQRVTASNFGFICKRKKASKWANVIMQLHYKNTKTEAMNYGNINESVAIRQFENKTGLKVEPCGLFVHEKYGFIGASPDGIVGEDAIIEVKCPFNARDMTISQAVQHYKQIKKYTFCIGSDFKLKRRHNFYFQIQGQLHVTKKKYCHFVLWTKEDMHHEIIWADEKFWKDSMEKHLVFYYKKVLLPELIDPRYARSLPIREPTENVLENTTSEDEATT